MSTAPDYNDARWITLYDVAVAYRRLGLGDELDCVEDLAILWDDEATAYWSLADVDRAEQNGLICAGYADACRAAIELACTARPRVVPQN